MTSKGQRVANWLRSHRWYINDDSILDKLSDVEFDQLVNGYCKNTKFPHQERNSGCTPGTCDCDCHIQLGGCPCVCEDCAKNNSVQNGLEGEEK